MNRKAICINCSKWFYNHNGQFICLPDTYDDSMCGDCNRKIDNEIQGNPSPKVEEGNMDKSINYVHLNCDCDDCQTMKKGLPNE